jgi:unsaturated chondroitin disaccharide hydrolase
MAHLLNWASAHNHRGHIRRLEGWQPDNQFAVRFVQWAGERGFTQTITSPNAGDFTFATGLTMQQNIPELRSPADHKTPWLAMWGEQVVEPANQAVSPYLKATNLGLAVIVEPGTNASANRDDKNYLLTFQLKDQSASGYTLAAWDKEASNNPVPVDREADRSRYVNFIASDQAVTSKDEFLTALRDQVSRIENPPTVRLLSTRPQAQSAPPDTLRLSGTRTYLQAIQLLNEEINRTAEKWAPISSASNPSIFAANSGDGFFTEADEQTGEWHPQRGFFWTGGFRTGELWKMFAFTHEDKYRKWAELWTSRLVGHEVEQNHDTGFLYFYSAVPGYELTRDVKLRESAIRAANHLQEMCNPVAQLIPAWSADGDDTIIDCMMSLQILWWASNETGDPKWREIALKHAQRTADCFVRDDGSAVQSVHYNPGDNRQHFHLRGGGDSDLVPRNHAAPGERVFSHTHQGYAWNITWSRGEEWGLYGFAVAYGETYHSRLLATAEKIAEYVSAELPEDGVPWYDFYDEGVLHRNRDSSAAAIISGGLLSLSALEPDSQKAARYRREAERIVHSLIDHYLTPTFAGDTTPAGILRHGCSTHPDDAGLIYGQYFLLEDLIELAPRK